MITLTFPDGTSLKAPTPSAALKRWRERQWHETDPQSFRDELAKRAWIWSESIVNAKAPAAQFLRELAEAGLVKVGRS